MANKDIEQKIKSAFSKSVPDILDSVLQQCSEQKGTVIEMTENKKKKGLIYKIAAIAAAFVVLFGGTAAVLSMIGVNIVETKVFFDVNPSVEILLNRNERVLEVNALNSDGEKIIGDMDFKGTDLEVSVNALIGSMLQNGYLSDIANSILVSVDNGDPQKAAELQLRLVENINAIIGGASIDGAILSQTISHDSDISALAEQYGVSCSKAQLISDILAENSLLTFEELAGLSINELNVLRQSDGITNDNLQITGTPSTDRYIGEKSAWNKAVNHAADNAENQELKKDISNLICEKTDENISAADGKVKLDIENGKMVYEVEFMVSDYDYEYEIDAVTGDVVKYDRELDDDYRDSSGNKKTTGDSSNSSDNKSSTSNNNSSSSNNKSSSSNKKSSPSNNKSSSSGYIGEQKANDIAFKHAGVSVSSVNELETELDRENGTVVYDVSFSAGGYEYDYEINATTGKIARYDSEIDDDYRNGTDTKTSSNSKSSSNGKTTSNNKSSSSNDKSSSSNYIGEQKAKEIAFKHAGISDSSAKEFEAELDRENGVVIYDVSFSAGEYEYEYEINAITGEIFSHDKERD